MDDPSTTDAPFGAPGACSRRSARRRSARRRNGRAAIAAAAAVAMLGLAAGPALAAATDTFGGPDAVWAEGSTVGRYNVAFNGFGTVGITGQKLRLAPAAATSAGETHSALVTASVPSSDVNLALDVTTVAQRRTGSAPNPWECGWIIWNRADNDHLWYLAVKTNGWEIGRRDPSGAGGQLFVATGGAPATAVGQTRRVRIRHDGNRLRVWFDGKQVVDLRNADPVTRAPSIGLYSEDAIVDFDNVTWS